MDGVRTSRVGVVVAGPRIPRAAIELIDWLQQSQSAEGMCCLVVVDGIASAEPAAQTGSHVGDLLRSTVWAAIERAESRRLRGSYFDGFAATSWVEPNTLEGQLAVRHITAAADGGVTDSDRAHLRDASLGLLVQFGETPLEEQLAGLARAGLLKVCHGEGLLAPDAPWGYWEVLRRDGGTGFDIRHIPGDGGPCRSILAGKLPTQSYCLLNQAALSRRSGHYMKRVLEQFFDSGTLPEPRADLPRSGEYRSRPSAFDGVSYAFRSVARMLVGRLRSLLGLEERWGISYIDRGWRDAVLSKGTAVANPPGRFFADPFLHVHDGRVFCFVEDYVDTKKRGLISALEFERTGAKDLGNVIEEDFHLSFPYLFTFEGQLFMCPESNESGQIRIYRCTEFPLRWQLHSVAMQGVCAVDTMIFESAGRWWMLTNIDPAPKMKTFGELHLFSATDPLSGTWKPHPMNPLVIDPATARNGGLLRDGASIYRVAQARAFGSYGSYASIFRITALSDTSYREECVASVTPAFRRGLTGSHHMHSAGSHTVWDHKRWERPA
jgi:hypothetical protein